jgi:hypothetical protein
MRSPGCKTSFLAGISLPLAGGTIIKTPGMNFLTGKNV